MGYNGKVKNPLTGKEEVTRNATLHSLGHWPVLMNGVIGSQVRWDRANNVDVLGWELGQSPRHCIAAWNRQVQQWLYHYVYVRSFHTNVVRCL